MHEYVNLNIILYWLRHNTFGLTVFALFISAASNRFSEADLISHFLFLPPTFISLASTGITVKGKHGSMFHV